LTTYYYEALLRIQSPRSFSLHSRRTSIPGILTRRDQHDTTSLDIQYHYP